MGGQNEMNFKISYSQVEQALWSLLNTSFTEEGEWTVTHAVCELYDDYALVRNFEANTYERVYYSKDEETEEVSISRVEACRIVDVTESEYTTLKAVQAINNSFEALDTKLNELEEVKAEVENVKAEYATAQEQISANEQKIGEQEELISTLTTERDNFCAQANEAGTVITELQG
jgi:chromosome segregation ATPase